MSGDFPLSRPVGSETNSSAGTTFSTQSRVGAPTNTDGAQSASRAPRPSRSKVPWIIGSVLMVALVGAASAYFLSGTSDSHPSGPNYQDLTEECALISRPILDQYTPGAVCKRTPSSPGAAGSNATHLPSWAADSTARPASIQLRLRIDSASPAIYDQTKAALVENYRDLLTNPTEIQMTVGDLDPRVQEAHLISGASKAITGRADAQLVARSGNAVVDVIFTDWSGPAASDAAVRAIAKDILANLK